jgi:hypothetical protein
LTGEEKLKFALEKMVAQRERIEQAFEKKKTKLETLQKKRQEENIEEQKFEVTAEDMAILAQAKFNMKRNAPQFG